MSQHDFNIANADGATVRADLNNALSAVATCSSGATAPATPFTYQLWADTAADLMKQRNAANTAWVSLYTLSTGAPADADIPTIAATQTEMEAGIENGIRSMSPLRVMQAITNQVAAAACATLMQQNRIDASWVIPNGINAITITPFEVSPNITVSGLGNATWRGI